MKYFEVKNDDRHLVIDDTYRNICLTRKIRINDLPYVPYFTQLTDRSYSALPTFFKLDLNENEVMVAVSDIDKKPFAYATINYSSLYNQKYEHQGRSVGIFVPMSHSELYSGKKPVVNNTLYAYVFGTVPNSNKQNNSGLQIYDAYNRVVYDSNYKYLKLVKTFTKDLYGNGDVDCFLDRTNHIVGSVPDFASIPSDKNYGVVCAGCECIYDNPMPYEASWIMSGIHFNGASYRFAEIELYTGTPAEEEGYAFISLPNYFIVDVTNF